MAYEKQTWQTGDIITAEKLNHLEGGVQNAFSPYVVTFETSDVRNFTCDRTFEEIESAYKERYIIGLMKINSELVKANVVLNFIGGDAEHGFIFQHISFEKGETVAQFNIVQITHNSDGSIVFKSTTYPET